MSASHTIRNNLNSFLELNVMLLKAQLMPQCSELKATVNAQLFCNTLLIP